MYPASVARFILEDVEEFELHCPSVFRQSTFWLAQNRESWDGEEEMGVDGWIRAGRWLY